MNFRYTPKSGDIKDGAYRQYGHFTAPWTNTELPVTIDFQFRLATNGIIVNTLVNDEPLFTTSAGTFNQ